MWMANEANKVMRSIAFVVVYMFVSLMITIMLKLIVLYYKSYGDYYLLVVGMGISTLLLASKYLWGEE